MSTPIEHRRSDFVVSTDRERLDLDVIHGFLTTAYWAKGVPRETVARAIEHSLCFGVYTVSGSQVGFARVISDFATFAYLADVFILESHRGRLEYQPNLPHGSIFVATLPIESEPGS